MQFPLKILLAGSRMRITILFDRFLKSFNFDVGTAGPDLRRAL